VVLINEMREKYPSFHLFSCCKGSSICSQFTSRQELSTIPTRIISYSCVCEMWCRMGCIGSTVHPIGRYIHQPLPSPRPSMTRMLGMLFTNRRRWFQQQMHHLAFRQAHGPRSTVTRLVWPTHHLWSATTYQNLTPCLMTSTHRQRCTPLLPWNDERQV